MTHSWVETAEYVKVGAERIYTIAFNGSAPVVTVVLCGPFPSERLNSLAMWVKWARFLAAHRVRALRFDYRGTGESTGNFTNADFLTWREDIEKMSEGVAAKFPDEPLVLHGLGMGGLLGQQVFAAGQSDSLLMWSPPMEARDVLKQGLISRLAMDMALQKPGKRKTAQDYINELDSGQAIEVDGLTWSPGLWRTSQNLQLESQYALPGDGVDKGRAWSHVVLGSDMAPLVRSSTLLRAMNPRAAIVPAFPLNPDFGTFFQTNLDWILATITESREQLYA